jgi:ATP-binding cassette subfamily B protein
MIRWVLSFLRPHRKRVLLLSGLMLVQIALGVLEPWPLKVVIDYVLSADRRPLPEPVAGWVAAVTNGSLVAMLVLFVVGGVLLQLARELVTAWTTQVQVATGQRMVYDLRYRLFDHLQALGLTHHTATPTSDAVYRVDVDSYAIENLVMGGLFPVASALGTLSVMFAVLLKLDVTIGLLSLSVVPFLYLAQRYYMSTLVDREERVKELEATLMGRVFETFSAIRLVKSFARESHESARYSAAGERTLEARVALTWQQSLFSVIVTGITVLGTALVLVVGGLHVLDGRMTIGSLIVVIAYLAAVYGPLSAIAHTSGQLQGAVAGARRVRAALACAPEEVEDAGGLDASQVDGVVTFDRVSFAYPDHQPVLRDLTFTARPGEMVALVGLTGTGKTTLVSLIPRFYQPTQGRVLIDGIDVREFALRSLREQIAIVLQEPVLFQGTIAENLRYGRLDASDEDIEAAARAAHAHEFIMRLPDGYQTEIGEGGAGLSGGERQRLSVARALMKNAPILILDEPTSALDAISEEIVFSALGRLRARRTTMVIAHRLSTVRDADCILVLDDGRIVAEGRHDELLVASPLYRRMCARLSVGRSLDEPETVDELIEAAQS